MPCLPKRIYALGAVLFVALAGATYFFLIRFPDPPGIDGYFYLKQILMVGSKFEFYFKDYSLAFLGPAFLKAAGLSELTAYRLAVAIITGAWLGSVWVIVARISWDQPRAIRFVALALTVTFTFLNYALYELTFGYLKTAVAVIFFIWFLLALALNCAGRLKLWHAIPPAILAMLSHKTSFLLIAMALVALLAQRTRWRAMMLAAAGFLLGGLLFVTFFSEGAHYLSFLMSSVGFFPFEHIKWIEELVHEANLLHLSMGGAVVFVGSYYWLRPSLRPDLKFLGDFVFIFSLFAWLPLYTTGEEQPAYRMLLIYSALTPPLIFALLIRRPTLQILIGFFAGLTLAQFVLSRPLASLIPSYEQYSEEIAVLEQHVGEDDHLVCHHGLEFYVDYRTRIRCQIYLSEKPEQKRFRMVYAPPEDRWMKVRIHAEPKAIANVGLDYFLLREDDWQKIVQTERIKPDWRNPSEYRPGHIYAP